MRTTSGRAWPWRLAATLLVAGVGAGLVAAGLTVLLHTVQHLAFGYDVGSFEDGVTGAEPSRRVAVLVVGGVVAGVGWYLIGRFLPPAVRVRTAVQERRPMRTVTTVVESLLQIVVVGLGASLGRESAPRRTSGALGQFLGRVVRLGPEDLRVVVACAAGAGFGAVYGVPGAGALFTLEVLLRSRRPGHVLAAAVVSAVATVVAWVAVPRGTFYPVEVGAASWVLVLGAVLAGPVAAGAGWAFAAVTAWASAHRPTGWRLPATVLPVFAALGVLAIWAPSLLGNGRGPATLAFDAARPVWVLLLLGMAKPLVTAACLRAGATGGLVTPAFATGALLGAGLGGLWADLSHSTSGAPYGVLVACGVLVVTMRAPLTAVVLAWELTGTPWWFLLPLVLAGGGAWASTAGWKRVSA